MGQSNTMQILAPAGDFEKMRAAVFSGADCVYVGVEGFNARRSAGNFDSGQLAQAVGFCHARNCKVYAALNVLVFPGQEREIEEALESVVNAGCDGVIVQDLMVAGRVRALAPALPIFASTQMSVHSLAGVYQMAEMGFSRAILARELREEEIAHITRHSPIELEVFIHGALCVSVSGQCFMSAFLGGRSANRGACAAPCRLPFRAGETNEVCPKPAKEERQLSLKDLSILDALPRLQEMGVSSGKIEGRLRTPEYVAVVVDSARKALAGKAYDKKLLQNIFSRSGFTSGWFGGNWGKEMFGARTSEDEVAGKGALAAAHALYRREAPRVPVQMELRFNTKGGQLWVSDGTNRVTKEIKGPLQPAAKDPVAALRAALVKTGGTPFFVEKEEDGMIETGGAFLSAQEAGALRRAALEELLKIRQWSPQRVEAETDGRISEIHGDEAKAKGNVSAVLRKSSQTGRRPLLRARFETMAQMPQEAFSLCDELVLPLEEAEQVPAEVRGKTWLWLPRVLFGEKEVDAAKWIEKTRGTEFRGYEAQNIAHLRLCAELPLNAGFGLNCANAAAAAHLAEMGCEMVTLSPELTLRQMGDIAQRKMNLPDYDALCYGHFPLMVTRACPLKQVTDCGRCKLGGVLTDRKGQQFPVTCRHGVRTIYNPIPLWMADRLAEMPTNCATLYFTVESSKEAADILQAFCRGDVAPAQFTRGLYYKGVVP